MIAKPEIKPLQPRGGNLPVEVVQYELAGIALYGFIPSGVVYYLFHQMNSLVYIIRFAQEIPLSREKWTL